MPRYGPCDIDSIKRRIDTECSNVVLTITQMQVLWNASPKTAKTAAPAYGQQPAAPSSPLPFTPSVASNTSSNPQSANIHIPTFVSTSPPLPACQEVDAVTRCATAPWQRVLLMRFSPDTQRCIMFGFLKLLQV